MVDSEPNPGILGARWEYTLDETHLHIHIHPRRSLKSPFDLPVSLEVEIG